MLEVPVLEMRSCAVPAAGIDPSITPPPGTQVSSACSTVSPSP